MTTKRTIIIVKEAYAGKLSILSGLMGWPQDYTIAPAVCAFDPATTPESTVTHRVTNAEGTMPQEIIDRFIALTNGDYLPQVDYDQIDGLTLADALEAPNNVKVSSKSGNVSDGAPKTAEQDMKDSLLVENLMLRPTVEI